MDDGPVHVEVACALGDRQQLVSVDVPPGTTARQAALAAGLCDRFPEIDFYRCALAIYGEPVADDRPLADGDRLEILRPLRREPRDARRELAARGQTMANSRAGGSS
jgi:putative ubiquitin-RnfH superfamily antitoxin RatB of RatAB toxin-antitoxin module